MDHFVYPAGSIWADPDLDQAAEAMRRVFEEREHAAVVARQAAQDIRRNFSAQKVGREMVQRMQLVAWQTG